MKPGDLIRGSRLPRSRDCLDWSAIALAGDIGAGVPQLEPAPVAAGGGRRWRPGKVSILLLVTWLMWEAAGVARAVTIGPPILEAIWSQRP